MIFGRGNKVHRESRRLNARIKKLHKRQAKLELKGCLGDEELKAKEAALAALRQEILDLEQKREKLWATNLLKSRAEEEGSKAE